MTPSFEPKSPAEIKNEQQWKAYARLHGYGSPQPIVPSQPPFTAINGTVCWGSLRLDVTMIDRLERIFDDAFSDASVTGDLVSARAAKDLGFALSDAEAEAKRQRQQQRGAA